VLPSVRSDASLSQLSADGSVASANTATVTINGKTNTINIQFEDLTKDTFYDNDCLATVYAMIASAYTGKTYLAKTYTSPIFTTGATPNPQSSVSPVAGAPNITRSGLNSLNTIPTTFPFVLKGTITGTGGEPLDHYLLITGKSGDSFVALDPLTGSVVTVGLNPVTNLYVVTGGANVQGFYATGWFSVSVSG
jgi:hypothetical protein